MKGPRLLIIGAGVAVAVALAVALIGSPAPREQEPQSAAFVPPLAVETTAIGLPLEASPRSVHRYGRYPADHVAVGGGSVWVAGDNELARIDARTYEVRDDLMHFPVAEIWDMEWVSAHLWILATDDPPDRGDVILYRIDTQTLERRRIDLGGGIAEFAEPALTVAGGSIWVAAPHADHELTRIEAPSGRRDYVALPAGVRTPVGLAGDENAVWISARSEGAARNESMVVLKLSPTTGEPLDAPLEGACFDRLAADGTSLWALQTTCRARTRLVRIDPATLDIVSQGVDRGFALSARTTVRSGLGYLWLNGGEGKLLAVDRRGRMRDATELNPPFLGGTMDAGEGSLWVASGAGVVRVDVGRAPRARASPSPPVSLPTTTEFFVHREGAVWPETDLADARAQCDAVHDTRGNLFLLDAAQVALEFARAELTWSARLAGKSRLSSEAMSVTVARGPRRAEPRVNVTTTLIPGTDCWWVTEVKPASRAPQRVNIQVSDQGDLLEFERRVKLLFPRANAPRIDAFISYGGRQKRLVSDDRDQNELRASFTFRHNDFPVRNNAALADRSITGHYLILFLDRKNRVYTSLGGVLPSPGTRKAAWLS